ALQGVLPEQVEG
ncbi:hypothetical protein KIPB_015141, partial [Kipferlia bialata]